MSYQVKEIFYTLQGEGANSGRPAVFCRFTGCNLWSGREKDRSSAVCKFCDTDFVGTNGTNGGRFSAEELVDTIKSCAPLNDVRTLVVCTGGEPLLQLDSSLINILHEENCEIAVETNGTILCPDGVDWICVSPKAGTDIIQCKGQELKFIFPQFGVEPKQFEHLDFQHFFIQPMDGPNKLLNTNISIKYCLENPKWRLSLQTHKIVGIP